MMVVKTHELLANNVIKNSSLALIWWWLKKNSFGAVITIKTSRNMDKYVIKTCQMVLFLLILIWWRWKKGPFDAVMIILHLAD